MTKRSNKQWSYDEIAYLLDHESDGNLSIANQLGRSTGSVSMVLCLREAAHQNKGWAIIQNHHIVELVQKWEQSKGIFPITPKNGVAVPSPVKVSPTPTQDDPYKTLEQSFTLLQGAIENIIMYEVNKRVKEEREKNKQILEEAKQVNWFANLKKKFQGTSI